MPGVINYFYKTVSFKILLHNTLFSLYSFKVTCTCQTRKSYRSLHMIKYVVSFWLQWQQAEKQCSWLFILRKGQGLCWCHGCLDLRTPVSEGCGFLLLSSPTSQSPLWSPCAFSVMLWCMLKPKEDRIFSWRFKLEKCKQGLGSQPYHWLVRTQHWISHIVLCLFEKGGWRRRVTTVWWPLAVAGRGTVVDLGRRPANTIFRKKESRWFEMSWSKPVL